MVIHPGYLPADRSRDWLYTLVELVSLLTVLSTAYVVCVRYGDLTSLVRVDNFGSTLLPNEHGAVAIALPCAIGAILLHPDLNEHFVTDALWTFVLYLETFAVLPQLCLRLGRLDSSLHSFGCSHTPSSRATRTASLVGAWCSLNSLTWACSGTFSCSTSKHNGTAWC